MALCGYWVLPKAKHDKQSTKQLQLLRLENRKYVKKIGSSNLYKCFSNWNFVAFCLLKPTLAGAPCAASWLNVPLGESATLLQTLLWRLGRHC